MGVQSSKCIKNGFSFSDRKKSHTAVYEVRTDDRTMAGEDVVAGAQASSPDPVPAAFATFALFGGSDANAFCQEITAEQPEPVNAAQKWHVNVKWFPIEGDPEDDTTNADDPLSRPLRFHSTTEEILEIVENGWNVEELPFLSRAPDTYGPIVTAVGDRPGTPLVRPRKAQVLIITKNFATLAEILALQDAFVDKLNQSPFYGAPKGKAIVRDIIPSQEMFAGGTAYREAEFYIAAYRKGWNFPMVNRGFNYAKDGAKLPITKDGATLVAEPELLELDGTLTPSGALGTVINWRLSEYAEFAGMGIGG